jgi:hypothetical protein
MFFDLQDSQNRRELAWLADARAPAVGCGVVNLLAADGSEWDAPLMGDARAALSCATDPRRLQASPFKPWQATAGTAGNVSDRATARFRHRLVTPR